MPNPTVSSSGITYGPNPNGKLYISVYYHRGNRGNPHKNKWHPSITPSLEYDIFCNSDANTIIDSDGNYWGWSDDGKTILGCLEERLCFFPCTSNPTDPWHGFPVSPSMNGDNDAPSDVTIKTWMSNGIISRTFARRIVKRKI